MRARGVKIDAFCLGSLKGTKRDYNGDMGIPFSNGRPESTSERMFRNKQFKKTR